MGKKQQVITWTPRDTALWHTCEIAVDLVRGVVPEPRQEVRTTFPPRLAADERFWAYGPFELFAQRAPGDGSYVHDGGFFFATGAVGLAATAAFAGARAVGNSNRRRTAEQAATPRWTPIETGNVYVSVLGLHLHTAHSLLPWVWHGFTAMEMVGPGAVHVLGNSDSGPVSWVLRSDWAELVFVTWALAHHRRHPQFLSGGWLPPGWLDWASGQSYPIRLSSPVISV